MAGILFVNACVRPGSRTLELASHVLGRISGDVEEVDLYSVPLSPLDMEGMAKRERAAREQDHSDEAFRLAKQFSLADTVVIAAPYWDLMFPAVLKTYLETITVVGITFRYSPEGVPVGLCRGKKLYYITTSGGFIGENDFGASYVRTLAQTFYGIRDVQCFRAEGLDVFPEDAEAIMKKAKENVDRILA